MAAALEAGLSSLRKRNSRPCMSNHRRYPNADDNMSRRPGNNNGWGQSEELLNDHLESQMDELGNTVSSLRNVRSRTTSALTLPFIYYQFRPSMGPKLLLWSQRRATKVKFLFKPHISRFSARYEH